MTDRTTQAPTGPEIRACGRLAGIVDSGERVYKY